MEIFQAPEALQMKITFFMIPLMVIEFHDYILFCSISGNVIMLYELDVKKKNPIEMIVFHVEAFSSWYIQVVH